MKFRFMKGRKIVNGKLTNKGGKVLVLDLPHIVDEVGCPVYIDKRPLRTKADHLPKFYEDDPFMSVTLDSEDYVSLIVTGSMSLIEEVTEYPHDKPLVWVNSRKDSKRYYGYTKQMFDCIKYVPVD